MSSTNPGAGPAVSATALVWAIALMFAVTVAGAVIVAVFLPEQAATLAGALLAAFALLVTNLGTLFKIGKVEAKVDDVKEQTNGSLDRRIRAEAYKSMRKALEDHLDENGDDPTTPTQA